MKTSEKPMKGTWILVLDILVLLLTILSVKSRIQTRIEYKHIKENCSLVEGRVEYAGEVSSGLKLSHSKHNYTLTYGNNQSIVVSIPIKESTYYISFDSIPVIAGNQYFMGNQVNVYTNNSNRTIAYLESELTPPSILGIIGIILLGLILVAGLSFIFLTVRWGYDKIHGESQKQAKKEQKEKKEQKTKSPTEAVPDEKPTQENDPADSADEPAKPEE